MSELKYESLIPQEYSRIKTTFDDQTVVFILGGSNTPVIGYSGEFLFKRTIHKSKLTFTETTGTDVKTVYTKLSAIAIANGPTERTIYYAKDFDTGEMIELGELTSFDSSSTNYYIKSNETVDVEDPNDDSDLCTNKYSYRYYERVKDMIFKFGIKHEYYKNSHGVWIDMMAIRKNMGTFLPMITGLIDESLESGEFKTSTYVKIADYFFHGSGDSTIYKQFHVDKTNIPRATFIDSNGKYWEIGPGDGSIEITEPTGYQFKRYLESENIDNIHLQDDKYILFDQELSNAETGLVASKSYENNDVHKFDDLKLTFLHVDKTTPFTDLDNLLIFVNGLIVDYTRHPTLENVIYLPNVKRLASLQQVGLKSGYGPDNHLTYQKVGNKNCIYYEFDNTKCKYSYKFDIQIYKWDNVKLSHFTLPINRYSVLKSETYSMNTFWLPTKLQFSDEVNKDKSILICSGEIIPKSEWDIDPKDKHTIRLLYNEFEFDQLLNEMTKKMKEYLYQVIEHDEENQPQLKDYIIDYSSEDSINDGFNNYVAAMNEYLDSVSGGMYDNHFALSAINTVIKEFDNRTYSLVTIKIIKDSSYDIEFYENHEDIIVDKPRINQLTNINWSPDDIVIINGMTHDMVNVYDNKFMIPTTSWLPSEDNIFEHCDAYKLQVIKLTK